MGETDKIMKTPGILLSGSNRIIEKLHIDFFTACQCKGTGADVAGNAQGQWIDMDIIAGEFRLYLGAKLLRCGSVVGISDL